MGYLAWLNAAPENPPSKKGEAPRQEKPRRDQIEAAGMQVVIPPIERGEHLVGYLFEFGPTGANGPLTAGEVLDIERVLGVEFDPWESRLLVRLSREYQGRLFAATKPDAPCPIAELGWQWRRVRMLQSERNLDAFCR